MIDIGSYEGQEGLDRLLKETNKILLEREKAIIAIAGLPGAGKTRMVKSFVRFGFGNFRRKDVLVIDDNIIYSTRFWKFHWEKIKLEKISYKDFVDSIDFKVLFFSNWIPSRYIDFADVLIRLEVDEQERIARLEKRYRRNPEKVLIQKVKTTVPVEAPFECHRVMTLSDYYDEMSSWGISWMIKRLFLQIYLKIRIIFTIK